MKTVSRIFGVLAILIAFVTCGMSVYRSNLDREDLATERVEADARMAKYKEQISAMEGEQKIFMEQQMAEAEKAMNEGPSESTYLILAVLYSGLLLLALAFMVLLFRPNLNLTGKLLAAAIVLFVAAYFLSPDIKRGTYGGADSRTLALLSAIPVIFAGLCAFLAAKKSAVKAN